MSSAFDKLWRAAQERPWLDRPLKSDVESLAPAMSPNDDVDFVWRLIWSASGASALAVTSKTVLVGERYPGRVFKGVLKSAPSAFRFGTCVLAIPRERIQRVDLSPLRVSLHTDIGPVHLPLAAGSNRKANLEQALLALTEPPIESLGAGLHAADEFPARLDAGAPSTPPRDEYPGLWSSRDLVDGAIRIRRSPTTSPNRGWLSAAGRVWRLPPVGVQWIGALTLITGLQAVASPAGVLFGLLLLVLLYCTDPDVIAKRAPRRRSPEARLALAGTIEARVAGAATRAWDETQQEPSWRSSMLEATRQAFDGDREVEAIVDLAVRIHAARGQLGTRPTSPAAVVWQQQLDALDKAALRLGDRADALIRHRDQAEQLTAELAQLEDLEKLERSALIIDDLTIESSSGGHLFEHTSVGEQITAARQTVSELIDLMTSTRAPLAEPIAPSPFPAKGLPAAGVGG